MPVSIDVKYIHNAYIFCLCCVALTMPLGLRLNSIAIIVTGASAFAHFAYSRNRVELNSQFFFFVSLYLGAFVGLANSTSLSPAIFDLEQKLPWLALALIFVLGGPISKAEMNLVLKSFLLSLTCVSFYALLTPESFLNQPIESIVNMTWFSWSESLPIGRIYLGLYCVFGLVVTKHFFDEFARAYHKVLWALLFIFLLVSLLNTFAKAAMGLFVALGCVELALLVYNSKKLYKFLSLLISIIAIVILSVTENPFREMAKKILRKETFQFSDRPLLFESINFRYVNWGSSWSVLKKNENWLTGVGTGDAQGELDKEYQKRVSDHERNYLVIGYNSHNQFLTTWLNYGLVFFLILVFQFIYTFWKYASRGAKLSVYFLVIVVGSCMTESLFERQQGIVFYTFFNLLFISQMGRSVHSASFRAIQTTR